jgi:hypothetical protein
MGFENYRMHMDIIEKDRENNTKHALLMSFLHKGSLFLSESRDRGPGSVDFARRMHTASSRRSTPACVQKFTPYVPIVCVGVCRGRPGQITGWGHTSHMRAASRVYSSSATSRPSLPFNAHKQETHARSWCSLAIYSNTSKPALSSRQLRLLGSSFHLCATVNHPPQYEMENGPKQTY